MKQLVVFGSITSLLMPALLAAQGASVVNIDIDATRKGRLCDPAHYLRNFFRTDWQFNLQRALGGNSTEPQL